MVKGSMLPLLVMLHLDLEQSAVAEQDERELPGHGVEGWQVAADLVEGLLGLNEGVKLVRSEEQVSDQFEHRQVGQGVDLTLEQEGELTLDQSLHPLPAQVAAELQPVKGDESLSDQCGYQSAA